MRRQKRDRTERAWHRGYKAGLEGRRREQCPHQQLALRESWLAGWREGRLADWAGHARLSAAYMGTASPF